MSFNGFVRVSYGLYRNKKNMQNKNKTRPSAPIFSENLTINNQFILHGLIMASAWPKDTLTVYNVRGYSATGFVRYWSLVLCDTGLAGVVPGCIYAAAAELFSRENLFLCLYSHRSRRFRDLELHEQFCLACWLSLLPGDGRSKFKV